MGFNCLKATATSRRQFTFYHSVPRNSWYSFYRPQKDERLSRPWSHPVVLNTGLLDWESSALNTRPFAMMKCDTPCSFKSFGHLEKHFLLFNHTFLWPCLRFNHLFWFESSLKSEHLYQIALLVVNHYFLWNDLPCIQGFFWEFLHDHLCVRHWALMEKGME